MREYLLRVIVSFLLCGLLVSLINDPVQKKLVRLITGLMLSVTVLQPLLKTDFQIRNFFPKAASEDANEICAYGERIVQEEKERRITEACEAYILTKAGMMDEDICLEIIVDDALIPTASIVQGEISGQEEVRLQTILESDLGITKENQQWIGILEKNVS